MGSKEPIRSLLTARPDFHPPEVGPPRVSHALLRPRQSRARRVSRGPRPKGRVPYTYRGPGGRGRRSSVVNPDRGRPCRHVDMTPKAAIEMSGQQDAPRTQRREFGSLRQTSNGNWQARYTAPDGTQRKGPTTFATKTDARNYLAQVRVDMRNGTWLDPLAPEPPQQEEAITVADYFPHFLSTRQGRGGPVKPRTIEMYQAHYRRFVHEQLGSFRLDAVTPHQVSKWNATITESEFVRRQAYSMLSALFNQAVREDLIDRSPCRERGAGQDNYQPRPFMSIQQADLILSHMTGEIGTLARLAFNTQMRHGEALALRWSDVDLPNRVLTIRRSVSETKAGQVETRTKSGKERRIHLDAETVALLREHRAQHPRLDAARVFLREDGLPLRHRNVTYEWGKAREKAGLAEYRLHDLRHCGLTALASAGLPLSSIQARAGHSTVKAAMNYQHRAQSQGEIEAKVFAQAKEAARNGTRMAQGDSPAAYNP